MQQLSAHIDCCGPCMVHTTFIHFPPPLPTPYRYAEVRGRLMRCRHPSDVNKLDRQLAQEWTWLQDVRRGTAAAARQCSKQVR